MDITRFAVNAPVWGAFDGMSVFLSTVLAGDIATDSDETKGHHPPTFTKANVISTILTLWLCCLTQPYGLLVFRGPEHWLRRLSPLSSAIEGVMIVICLLTTPHGRQSGLLGGPSSTATSIRRRISRSVHGYRLTAGVLLLHRSENTHSITGHARAAETQYYDSQSRNHLRIQIFTTIPVVFVLIKPCVVSGVPFLVACGFMYVFS